MIFSEVCWVEHIDILMCDMTSATDLEFFGAHAKIFESLRPQLGASFGGYSSHSEAIFSLFFFFLQLLIAVHLLLFGHHFETGGTKRQKAGNTSENGGHVAGNKRSRGGFCISTSNVHLLWCLFSSWNCCSSRFNGLKLIVSPWHLTASHPTLPYLVRHAMPCWSCSHAPQARLSNQAPDVLQRSFFYHLVNSVTWIMNYWTSTHVFFFQYIHHQTKNAGPFPVLERHCFPHGFLW